MDAVSSKTILDSGKGHFPQSEKQPTRGNLYNKDKQYTRSKRIYNTDTDAVSGKTTLPFSSNDDSGLWTHQQYRNATLTLDSGRGYFSHQNEKQPTRGNLYNDDKTFNRARRNYNRDTDAVSGKTTSQLSSGGDSRLWTHLQYRNATSTLVQKEDCIRLVLLGRTGSGKSATGNTILGRKEFESRPSGSSVTDRCKISRGMLEKRQVAIVDTPGFFDTNHPTNESTKEVSRCINLSSPGPHAFLLVLKADRFTDEENETVTNLLKLFGDHMLAYTVVIFTRLDDLEEDGTTLQEFIESSSDAMKRLIKRVNFRIIAFNNKANGDQKAEYVSSLHRTVNKMQQTNDGKHYTCEMYKEAESKILMEIRIAERRKEKEKQRTVELVKSKFKGEMSNAERRKSHLQNELCKQKEQQKRIETEYQESQQRIVNIQNNLSRTKFDNQIELRKTVEEENQKVEAKLDARRHQQYSPPPFISSWVRNDEQQRKILEDEKIMNQKIEVHNQEIVRILVDAIIEQKEAEVQKQLLEDKRERDKINFENRRIKNELEEITRKEELQERQRNEERRYFRRSTIRLCESHIEKIDEQLPYYKKPDDDSSCVML